MLRLLFLFTGICLVTSLEVTTNAEQNATQHSTAILHCSYSGVPEGATSVTLEWKRVAPTGSPVTLAMKAVDGGMPTYTDRRYVIVDSASLQISNVGLDDNADHICSVRYLYEGRVTTDSSTVLLVVIAHEFTHAHMATEPTTGSPAGKPKAASTQSATKRSLPGETLKPTKMAATKPVPKTKSPADDTTKPAPHKISDPDSAHTISSGPFYMYALLLVALFSLGLWDFN